MISWFGFAHLFEECDSCDSKKTQLARVRARVVGATIRSNLFVGQKEVGEEWVGVV